MKSPPITDARRKLEIAAVLVTGLGKFVIMDWLQWKLPFILTAIVAWSIYVIVRQKKVPGVMQHWLPPGPKHARIAAYRPAEPIRTCAACLINA